MRMNTIAAIPMRILLGVLFFFMSVGHWWREEGEWIEREVPADKEQDEKGKPASEIWTKLTLYDYYRNEPYFTLTNHQQRK